MIFQRNYVQQTHVGLYNKLMISLEDYHMMWSENDILRHPRPSCPRSKASPPIQNVVSCYQLTFQTRHERPVVNFYIMQKGIKEKLKLGYA